MGLIQKYMMGLIQVTKTYLSFIGGIVNYLEAYMIARIIVLNYNIAYPHWNFKW